MQPEDCIKRIQTDLRSGRFTSEPAVSQGVVLPVLQVLGWPIFDTTIVIPEYSMEGLRVDFALCYPEKHPMVLLEVKKVGQLEGGDRQLFQYAFHKGVPIAVLSDGQEWHFYLPLEQGDYNDRRVYKLDLLEREADESCERLYRYLGYDSVCSGRAIDAARTDYEDVSRQRQVREALPKAWRRLLEEPDELLLELLAEKVEDICGFKPDPDSCTEYLAEIETSPSWPRREQPQTRTPTELQDAVQRPGLIGFSLDGREHRCNSAREVMTSLFELLARRDSAFLERFAAQKHGRTRRYVAHDRRELYPKRPDLCERESFRLSGNWYIVTNCSKRDIEKIIRLACEVAGITFGRDLTINLGA